MMPPDYGSAHLKDTLRQILQNVPPTHHNMPLIGMINDLLASESIDPIDYTYNATFFLAGANNAIAAGAAANTQVNIQADAPFLWISGTYLANTNNAAQTPTTRVIPNASVTLMDTGSGMNMMDQPTPIANIFGSGELPFVLPSPKLFTSNATLQVTVNNFDAAAGINLFLSFCGVKLFKNAS